MASSRPLPQTYRFQPFGGDDNHVLLLRPPHIRGTAGDAKLHFVRVRMPFAAVFQFIAEAHAVASTP